MPSGIVDVHRLTKLIAVSTAFGVILALYHQTDYLAFVVAEISVSLLVTAICAWCFHRRPSRTSTLGFVLPAMMAVPYLVETISRSAFAFGLPLEATTLCAVRNLIFIVFVFPKSDRCERIAISASLLAMLSICMLANRFTTTIFVLVHCILCMGWLIGSHWRQLQVKAPSESQRFIPRSAQFGVITITTLIAAISIAFYSNAQSTSAIAGFMPSSGGNQESSPFAFGGVGDGDQLARGTENAKSIGPVESDIFLESKMPSIYDVFNDLYNEPQERPKETARAIPLAPQDVVSNHEKLARNEVASREFSAIRQKTKPKDNRPKDDISSKALFYVSGRVPLHLKHNVYNHWDGTALSYRGKSKTPNLLLVSVKQQAWVACATDLSPSVSPNAEANSIRIARMKTERIPCPSNLKAVRIDRIHTARFFRWTTDGVVKFASNNIPAMSIIHTLSEPPRVDQLQQVAAISSATHDESHLDSRVERLLREWVSGATNDWQRINAVAEGIRTTCTLAPGTMMEGTREDVVEEFLLEKKSGPDYLFAIATARLLREIGCQVRVVSGFYADPKNYDRLSRQTAVYASDAHFWVEVQIGETDWATIDPSPGYEVRFGLIPFRERLIRQVMNALRILQRHRYFVLTGLLLGLALAIWKHHVYAHLLHWWWQLPIPRTDRRVVRSSLALWEAHSRLQGLSRAPGTTMERWLTESTNGGIDRPMGQITLDFQRLVQWSLYSAAKQPPGSLNVRQVCRNFISIGKRDFAKLSKTKNPGANQYAG